MPCPRRRPIHSRSLPGWAYQSLMRIAASLSSARPGYLIGLSGCALPPQLARILQSLQTGVDRRVVLGKAEPHDIGDGIVGVKGRNRNRGDKIGIATCRERVGRYV